MESGLDHFTKKYAGSRKVHVNGEIDRNDELYWFLTTDVRGTGPAATTRPAMSASEARMNYYKQGSDLARTIMQIANWRFPGKTHKIKMMEFACGYGRNVRHIVNCFPPKNVFVSDIYADAVKFNIEQFGVRGRVSVHNPSDLEWPSLFSHLPESTFSGWIAALHGRLSEDGILVFSVHDEHLLPPDIPLPDSGIFFRAQSESATLDKNEYGDSYVSEAFVREQIQKVTGRATYSRTKRGFWNHQDFYIISKNPNVDVASFRYDHGVVGNLEKIELAHGRSLRITGWAKDTINGSDQETLIEVYLGGRQIAKSRTCSWLRQYRQSGAGNVSTLFQLVSPWRMLATSSSP
jgi:hypothetical protein